MSVAESERASAHISAYIDTHTKTELEQRAEANERTVSAEVRLALRRHLAQPHPTVQPHQAA